MANLADHAAMELEPRHRRAFLAVADEGSANRAGSRLLRAQSAVSRSIVKLDRELGVKLFWLRPGRISAWAARAAARVAARPG